MKIDELHFHRFNSTPLETRRRARRVQPRHRAVDDPHEQPVPRLRADHDGPGDALRARQAALRHAGHRRRLRQQDHVAPAARRVLPARAQAQPRRCSGRSGAPTSTCRCRTATSAGSTTPRSRSRTTARCSASARRRSTTRARGCATSRSAASSGRRSRPGMYQLAAHPRSSSRRSRRTRRPCSPNRGYSRMQHLWFTERVIDIVAHELELDPIEVRKRNYIKRRGHAVRDAERLRLRLGRLRADARHRARPDRLGRASRSSGADAAARGKLLGVGIGSTLDSGTNNFGQSRMINPELQFSGNNEVATVKLDIFGEIVVTLGTTPQGQGHETTAAQVVADILGCSVDDVHVRAGHDSYWNSHAGFSGTYASQFAVTGLSAVKGATDMLARADQAARLGDPRRRAGRGARARRGHASGSRTTRRRRCRSWRAARSSTRTTPGLPEDLDVTLNCRYVYRPPFEVPDVERKFGNLTLTYAAQIHAAVIEIDPETGYYEIVDYAAVDDCGKRINPQIVEGQVMGATAQALGAVDARGRSSTTRTGTCLTPNFYDYHVPHALDMPPLQTGYDREPVAVHAARHEGHGRGRRRRHPRGLRGDPGRAARPRRRDRLRQLEPVPARLGDARAPGDRRRARRRWWTHERRGRAHVRRAARDRVAGAERSGVDGEDDARRRELRRPRRRSAGPRT